MDRPTATPELVNLHLAHQAALAVGRVLISGPYTSDELAASRHNILVAYNDYWNAVGFACTDDVPADVIPLWSEVYATEIRLNNDVVKAAAQVTA